MWVLVEFKVTPKRIVNECNTPTAAIAILFIYVIDRS